MIVAYILTLSVYAFTFGRYFAELTGGNVDLARFASLAVLGTLGTVNIVGVKEASGVAVFTVYAKLLVLLALAAAGLWAFDSRAIAYEAAKPGGLLGAFVGAGAVFMAYEGFQLLAYDFEVMHRPRRTLRLAMYTAVPVVAVVYIAVALAVASLIGAPAVVANGEIALAAAGQAAWGPGGKIVVSVGALFAAASAINATLFATARLVQTVAERGELPGLFARESSQGVPVVGLVVLSVCAGLLAVVGQLGRLVEAASLVFLLTFAIVNGLAAVRTHERRLLEWSGAIACLIFAGFLVWRLVISDPATLAALAFLLFGVTIARMVTAHSRKHGAVMLVNPLTTASGTDDDEAKGVDPSDLI